MLIKSTYVLLRICLSFQFVQLKYLVLAQYSTQTSERYISILLSEHGECLLNYSNSLLHLARCKPVRTH